MAKRIRIGSGSLKRRDFLAMATAGAASMVTAWPGANPGSNTLLAMGKGAAPAVETGGISKEAYEAARKRAAALVAQLTLEEKIAQFGAHAPAVPRVGLPAFNYYGSEALHGLIHGGPITSFPLPLAMGCSWNRSLVERVFTAVSDEIWAWHKKDGQSLAMFSPPTVNMGTRDPRWGRIGENYSEDPCLVSEMAVQTIHGMQGRDSSYLKTIACAKHFIANDTDDDREETSASVDPRSFWEYYSRGFEACVREGHVFTVMSSYNEMNGIPTSASHFLLHDLLRERWGFRGYVVSDCDAFGDIFRTHHFVSNYAQAAALAITAGGSINCGDTLEKHLGEAVDQMLISEMDLAKSLTHAFTGRVLLGEFDSPNPSPYSSTPIACLESAEHKDLCREAGRQSIVLFKNHDSTLPLDKARSKKIAAIGPMAETCQLGDYSGLPLTRISPLQGLKEYLGVSTGPVYGRRGDEVVQTNRGPQLRGNIEGGQYVDYDFNGSWLEFPKVAFDGATEFHMRVASEEHGGYMEVHLDSLTGPVVASIHVPGTGGRQSWMDVSTPLTPTHGEHTVFFTFTGGSGKLFSVASFHLTPAKPVTEKSSGVQLAYALGCSVKGPKDDDQFAEAVKAAKEADVVLLFLGVDQQVSQEARDRTDIRLPGAQHELAQAIYAANPRTVLVICSCCPVAVNWEQANLPAIVGGHFLGGQQGSALTDVLFGEYNPGGKLSTTWYRSVADLPDFHDYNVRHGRTYMYSRNAPLYPFGHGLSYTTFQYKDLHASEMTLKPGGNLTLTFDLTNTGGREGDEIVQLYVRFPESKVDRPIKQLANFERVHLKAGETKTVSLDLPYDHDALRYWDQAKYSFVVEPGPLEVMVGASSADIRLKQEVQLSNS